jgi:Mn2+ and Fe2+ transporters of the NRAMP family
MDRAADSTHQRQAGLRRSLDPKLTQETGQNTPMRRHHFWIVGLFMIWGPGLVVMLADTDAGSLITAAQSGTQFGYRMILPQLLLVPVLYVVQEMTVRLGILTGRGHGA